MVYATVLKCVGWRVMPAAALHIELQQVVDGAVLPACCLCYYTFSNLVAVCRFLNGQTIRRADRSLD